ncbi:MAG: DUF6062 family protein [Nitrososphaeria archaeon]
MKVSRHRKGKDITYVLLKDALQEKDCPICFLLVKHKEKWIDGLLYERVNDPHTRERIKSGGFCTRHLWDIFTYSAKHPGLDGLGISIILLDVLETQMVKLSAKDVDYFWGDKCILCESLIGLEESSLDSLALWFGDELLYHYGSSPSILCLRHFRSVLGKVGSEHRSILYQMQLSKLKKLNGDLKSFVRKFDWNVKDKPTFDEASAKELAAKVLRGGTY